MAAETLEDYYSRIIGLPRVVGFMVISLEGVGIKSTLGVSTTLKYAGQVGPLIDKARKMIRDLVVEEEENMTDDVCFMRLRTELHEVLIAPERDYAMIVLQQPHQELEDEDADAAEGEGGDKPKRAAAAEKEEIEDDFK